MAAGDSGVFVATRQHLDIVEQRLEVSSLDLNALRAQGRYVTPDADATLSKFMKDGWPNRDKFLDIVSGIISQAIARSPTRSVERSLYTAQCPYDFSVAMGEGNAPARSGAGEGLACQVMPPNLDFLPVGKECRL